MSAINQQNGSNDSFYGSPLKFNSTSFNTNNSFGFSSTIGQNKFKEFFQNASQFRSYELLRDVPGIQSVVVRGEDIQNNNSLMTLNPVVNPQDIDEIFQWQHMINFLSQKQKQQDNILTLKNASIKVLRDQRAQKQDKILKQKQKYEKLHDMTDRLRRRAKRRERRYSVGFDREILAMETEIRKMKRTLSNRKPTAPSPSGDHKVHNHQRRERTYNNEMSPMRNKRKNIIYMPIYYGNPYGYSQHPTINSNPSSTYPYGQHYGQHQSQYSQNIEPLNQPQHANRRQSTTPSKKMALLPSSRHLGYSTQNQQESPEIFQLLSNKLRSDSQQNTSKSQKNEGLISQQDIANAQKARGYNIQVHMPEANKALLEANNLDYLSESRVNQVQAEQIELLQKFKRKKSILDESEPSQGQEQVRKTLNELQEGSKNSQKKIKLELPSKPHNMLQSSAVKMRRESIDKLGHNWQNNSKEDQSSLSLPESSIHKEHNSSKINISYQQSEGKKSKLQESADKIFSSPKQQFMEQSNVNIILENSRFSSCYSEQKKMKQQSTRKSPRLQQQIATIQEVQEEAFSRATTPISTPLSNEMIKSLEPIKDSKNKKRAGSYKDLQKIKKTGSNMEQSQERSDPKTPKLSRPPSLIEQETKEASPDDEDDSDHLSNINLSPQSRKIQKVALFPSAKVNGKNVKRTPQDPNDEDDEIFSIKLLTESRHSREARMSMSSPREDLYEEKNVQYMARSEPEGRFRLSLPAGKSNDEQEKGFIAKSGILSNGSAIDKIKSRAQTNNIKVSSHGSPTHKTTSFAPPIEEEVEEEDVSPTQIKHSRTHGSSIR